MKILLVNHFPLAGSGSGVYTATIAKSLNSLGHEVAIIMPEVTTNFEKIVGIHYHPVYFKGEEKIDDQLPFNFPCFTTHPKSTNTFANLSDEELHLYIEKFEEAIRSEVETWKPDIIHGQHIWILSALASNMAIPLIVTAHGTDLIGYQESERFHSYVDRTIEKVEKIVTISKNNDVLVNCLFPGIKERTVVIENGYDTNVFYPGEYERESVLATYGITKKYEKIVLFVGKLTAIKGVDMLIESARTYQEENVLTLIVGDGEERNRLETQSKGLENIVFLGNRTQSELQKIYSIADVSVVPSRKEAFGFVAVEALACGTPVIGSDQGELPNFINERTGILIHTGNNDELTDALNKIIHGEVSYDRNYIATYARGKYSLENSIYKLLKVYEDAKKTYKEKEHILCDANPK